MRLARYLLFAMRFARHALRPSMPQRHRETEKNKADQQQPGAKPLKELPAIARLLPIRRRILRVPSLGRQVNWDIENQGGDKRGLIEADALIPGAAEALRVLIQKEIPFRIVTNTTSKPRSAILASQAARAGGSSYGRSN